MLGVVGAVAFAGELVVHAVLVSLQFDALHGLARLAADGFGCIGLVVGHGDGCCRCVRPALRVEAVGAADEEVGRFGDGQHSDVVLAFILMKEKSN